MRVYITKRGRCGWVMAKGHTVNKAVTCQMMAEAARLKIVDAEAQWLNQEDVD